ncbi:hypothetical protein Rsub_09462 [Raphidocelis subcapitata]|uniref:Protein kinase domain-containing protein n=1 Tax=Raphidocelis subcapitata TaxID=307507 RepID=A0A2V0PFN5_9CHLO|nr:hypothetical protein Rsub_09462 [Raphidocelis subcapitata]|eukprot:GBF96720.1 hypothetical protein Rsub_09462 [Raphidocelis subcapitata]
MGLACCFRPSTADDAAGGPRRGGSASTRGGGCGAELQPPASARGAASAPVPAPAPAPAARLPSSSLLDPYTLSASSLQSRLARDSAAGFGAAAAAATRSTNSQSLSGAGRVPSGEAFGLEPASSGSCSVHEGMIRTVGLLQELLALTAGAQRPRLSAAAALLVARLPVDYVCLHAASPSGRTAMRVAAALSPDAQRGGPGGGGGGGGGSGGPLLPLPGGSFRSLAAGSGGTPPAVLELGAAPPFDLPACSGDGGGGGGGPGGDTAVGTVLDSAAALALHLPAGAAPAPAPAPAALPAVGECCGAPEELPADWAALARDCDLRSFLALPVVEPSGGGGGGGGDGRGRRGGGGWDEPARGAARERPGQAGPEGGRVIGVLTVATVAVTDWGEAWWMPSVQLLSGWAAGTLPQYRCGARAALLEAARAADSLESLAACLVHGLPRALADPGLEPIEARLALVTARRDRAVLFFSDAPPGPPPFGSAFGYRGASSGGALPRGLLLSAVAADGSHSAAAAAAAAAAAGTLELTGTGGTATSGGRTATTTTGDSASDDCRRPPSPGGGGCGGGSEGREAAAIWRAAEQGVARAVVGTADTVLLSALEWGEVMTVKDTVSYFGRGSLGAGGGAAAADSFSAAAASSPPGPGFGGFQGGFQAQPAAAPGAGAGGAADLFLAGRPLPRGTLVLLPLVHRCRQLGCVYLLAPWDLHAAVGRAALAEMAALLSGCLLSVLVGSRPLRREWYALLAGRDADGGDGEAAAEAATVPPPPLPQLAPEQQQRQRQEQQQTRTPQSGSSAGGSAPLPEPPAAAAGPQRAAPAAAAACPAAPCDGAAAGPSEAAAGPSEATALLREAARWPELLQLEEEAARGRHTVVYRASFFGTPLAVKAFRLATSNSSFEALAAPPQGPAGGGGAGGGGPSAGAGGGAPAAGGASGASGIAAEIEAVMAVQARLCGLRSPFVARQYAAFPYVYEVGSRRGGGAPLRAAGPGGGEAFLSAVLPRRERAHRCCALVSEFCGGGTLRDAVARGDFAAAAVAAAAAAAGLGPGHYGGEYAPSAAPAADAAAPATAARHAPLAAHAFDPPPPPQPPPDLALLRAALLQIARGLHFLHSHGIVHGEVRTDNIMLTDPIPRADNGGGAGGAASGEGAATGAAAAAASLAAGVGSGGAAGAAGGGAGGEARPRDRAAVDAASALPGGVCLRLKDAGLCTLSLSGGRSLNLRKLAGRARLHGVAWLPPECFKGEGIGRGTDVYAFGMLIAELLTGQPAFPGLAAAPAKLLHAILYDNLRPALPEGTPGWLSALAAQCWAPSPRDRPSFRRIAAALAALPPEALVWGGPRDGGAGGSGAE